MAYVETRTNLVRHRKGKGQVMGFKHVHNRARKAPKRPAKASSGNGRPKAPLHTVPPSRADPTRTGGIRRGFIAALRKGYANLKRMVRELVLREMGNPSHGTGTTTVINDPTGNAWTYETNPNKVKRFREWLRAQTGSVLAGDQLIQEFIDKAYRKGTSRAYADLRRSRSSSSTATPSTTSKSTLAGRTGGSVMEGVYGGESQEGLGHTSRRRSNLGGTSTGRHTMGGRSTSTPLGGGFTIPQEILPGMVPGQPEEQNFVRMRMSKAPTVEKVKLLASRTFSELDGINQRMGAAMSRTLAEGLASGWTVHRMATQMSAQAGLAFKRAVTIVRTEIIRTHAEAQLDALEDLGERKVGVAVEWQTAEDNAVCPKCEGNEGEVFSIEDARGMIPVHPNCRCAWVPLKETKTRKRKEGK